MPDRTSSRSAGGNPTRPGARVVALVLLAALAVASAGESHATAGERLDAARLSAEIVGPSFHLLTHENERGTLRYSGDGTATIAIAARGLTDRGSWRIKGDLLCHRWRRLFAGEERCFVVEKVGAGKFVTSDDFLLWN